MNEYIALNVWGYEGWYSKFKDNWILIDFITYRHLLLPILKNISYQYQQHMTYLDYISFLLKLIFVVKIFIISVLIPRETKSFIKQPDKSVKVNSHSLLECKISYY